MKYQSKSGTCLIAGAGPVGLTMALLLQKYGVDFRLIEKDEEPKSRQKQPVSGLARWKFLNS